MNHQLKAGRAVVVGALVALGGFGAPAAAQTTPWTVIVSNERAGVDIGSFEGVWTTTAITTMWSQPESGGWAVTAERQERGGTADVALGGRAYKHAGGWTLLGGASATPNSHFLPGTTAEAELSRRLGNVVASAGYRYLGFTAVDIHQLDPAVTWYHSRGELEGRVFLTRNMNTLRNTTSGLMRASFAFTPRFRLAGGAAVGDRIFDVASLPYGSAHARVGFAEARVGITSRDFIQIGATVAHEEPAFNYQSFTLGYRRVF